jgi:DNA-directed RNA polymerase I subunit RPA12
MAENNEWMFCPLSGYLMVFDPAKGVAHCPQTGHMAPLEVFTGVKVMSRTNMEDYRCRYQLEPLVKEDAIAKEGARVRATVDEACKECGHVGLEFYTMQLRQLMKGRRCSTSAPSASTSGRLTTEK